MEQRKCKFCGKLFTPTNGMQLYCNGPHYDHCVICGKLIEVPKERLGAKDRRKTCSSECQEILRKQTEEKLYGSHDKAMSIIQHKLKKTSLQRYGVPKPSQTAEVKERIKQTNRKRYGTDSYTQTEQYKKQMDQYKQTRQYEQQRIQQHEQSLRKKFGDQVYDVQKEFNTRMIQKYGEDWKDQYVSNT